MKYIKNKYPHFVVVQTIVIKVSFYGNAMPYDFRSRNTLP